ncbi:hypothetical protein V8G54_020056 [Vigna mungo]|uniref:Fe2OG dioxygenase domain-containing protein n=1 Tax=Vigna mungo TaxID=3915 RepID=A0AAQ3NBK4_VIGMU
MEQQGNGASSFTSAVSLNKLGVSSIPRRYVLPPSQRPSPHLPISTTLPIIDLSTLRDQSLVSRSTINEIRIACKEIGCFQVINHGIDQSVMDEALEVSTQFFNLPSAEKMRLFSEDVHKPYRIGFTCGLQIRQTTVTYMKKSMEGRKHLPCPEPGLTLGIHPHSDYGSITVLLQTRSGLEIKDKNNNWMSVPFVEGALVVQLGDQMEVMSNGQYKSVIHRATVNGDEKRFSIVSLHSFAMDRKTGPAVELVDDQHPKSYKEFCFREFLDFISCNDITKGRFVDTLKLNRP